MPVPIPLNPDDPLFDLPSLPIDPNRFARSPPDALIRVVIDVGDSSSGFRRVVHYLPGQVTVSEFYASLPDTILELWKTSPRFQDAINDTGQSASELLTIHSAHRRV